MHYRFSVALACMFTFTACYAGDEFMLLVEEVKGPQPKLEQAADGASAYYGWLPATIDEQLFQITRSIELRISTATDFHLRLNQGSERTELKGKLNEAGDIHTQAPILSIGPWHAPLAAANAPRADFVVEYDYSIEEKVDEQIADLPSFRRIYAKGSLPISSERKFYLGGGQSGTRAFPTTLWSLKRIEPESGEKESSQAAREAPQSSTP